MNIEQLIKKIPKPLLVFVVLSVALIFIIYGNPLKDECEIKTNLFLKQMSGITNATKLKNKIQFPQIGFWKDRCREGNSLGSCDDYFEGLRKLTEAIRLFPTHCQSDFAAANEWLLKVILQGIQTMVLVAWGEQPPTGVAERLGWLTEANLKTFCILKKTFQELAGDDEMLRLKNSIYLQYPDIWPEKLSDDLKIPENRPKAFKTIENPKGSLTKEQIYERSLFSMRCDLYQ